MASRGQRSSVVEQLFRKQQVFGSNPNVGSTFLYTKRALDKVLADRAFAKTSSGCITRLAGRFAATMEAGANVAQW